MRKIDLITKTITNALGYEVAKVVSRVMYAMFAQMMASNLA